MSGTWPSLASHRLSWANRFRSQRRQWGPAGVLLLAALLAIEWRGQLARCQPTAIATAAAAAANYNNQRATLAQDYPSAGLRLEETPRWRILEATTTTTQASREDEHAGLGQAWPVHRPGTQRLTLVDMAPLQPHTQDTRQQPQQVSHEAGLVATAQPVVGQRPARRPISGPTPIMRPADPLYRSLLSLQNPKLFGGDILLRMGRRPPPPLPPPPPPPPSVQQQQSAPAGGGANRVLVKFERSAMASPVSRWPNGLIFYQLDPSVTRLARLIWSVMQQFHDETCIRFMPRLNNEPDFLRIEAHRGCFSYIGRVGGEQTLSLGDGCDHRGTIAHELLHTVGFYHHQNRSDRDQFLEILWENIAKGKEGQFEKMPPSETGQLNEFDYNSIMLYGPHTFGKTLDKITMKPKREGVILLEVIEKQGLSALDIDSVNKLYNCDPYVY